VWYFAQNNLDTNEVTDATEQTTHTSTENLNTFSGEGSIAALFTHDAQIRCEYRSEDGDMVSEGAVYIDGENKQYRMTGTQQSGATTETFGMIIDQGVMYSWGAGSEGASGIRMTLPEEGAAPTLPSEVSARSHSSMMIEQGTQYDCEPWQVDESVFMPPADVEFTDMDEMRERMMEDMPEGFAPPSGAPTSQ